MKLVRPVRPALPSTGLASALLIVVACAACGGRSPTMTARNVRVVYLRVEMARCLGRHHLNARSGGPNTLLSPLNQLDELTGAVDALPSGPRTGIPDFPSFQGVLLLFEQTAASAARNASAAVTALRKSQILIGDQKSLIPPTHELRAFDYVNGNVIVLWDYPANYRQRSHTIVADCFASSRSKAP